MKKFLSLLVLFITIACSTVKTLPYHPSGDGGGAGGLGFDTQGHRGSRGLMPENTFPAMKAALDLGVTTLEMDIVFTKDKRAILSHEPFFSHEITTRPDGYFVKEADEKSLNIYKMDYDEVKKYDVGLKLHPRFPQQQNIFQAPL